MISGGKGIRECADFRGFSEESIRDVSVISVFCPLSFALVFEILILKPIDLFPKTSLPSNEALGVSRATCKCRFQF
jgi:hypothetical protein